MTHATVFIIMDAGRSDYVRPETMPFVHGLAQRSVVGSFESPPGFAQRTVLFTGRYPDTSGNFSAFVFDPEASPFKWVRGARWMTGLVRPYRLLWPMRKVVQKVTKWKTGAYHTDPAWIPPKFLPFFRPCEDMRPIHEPGALGATSIFDLCRENGLKYRYLSHPVSGNDDEVTRILVRELRDGADYDVYFAQLSTCDQRGHVDGPFSDAMQKKHLADLDQKLASIHAALSQGYDSWDLFLCGDHGMGPVERQVDVLAALKKADAKPGTDYVVFVNSTLAVLWYLTERGRQEVEAVLKTIPGSRVLDDAERSRRRIPLDRRWGDRMLAADPGILFWPDYFHVKDSKIVGMHGYLDKRDETHGMCVLASSSSQERRDVGQRSLVDVFPTLCQMLEVPVPATNEGSSLLEPATVPQEGVAPRPKRGSRPKAGAVKARATER